MGTPRTPCSRRGIGKRATSAAPREGQGVVVADHRPDGRELVVPGREGGAPTSQGPPGGQATPGITLVWEDLGETRRAHPPSPCNARPWPRRPSALRRWCAPPGCP